MSAGQRLVLYHNPACSKSRAALAQLRERGADFDVVEYLSQPPDRRTLEAILARLPDPAASLVRRDDRFRELSLRAEDYETPESVVSLLLAHPELMQRPVAVRGSRAVLGRPPENVLALLDP